MAFLKLSMELLEMIAKQLNSDTELVNFALVCHDTHSVVEHQGLWRTIAHRHFDLPTYTRADELKVIYQARKNILNKPPSFRYGMSRPEVVCLALIHELVIESYESTQAKKYSNNLCTLRSFVNSSDILQNVVRFDHTTSPFLVATQLLCAPWSIEFWRICPTWSFPHSQLAAYDEPASSPMFNLEGRGIDVHTILDIANFFKYYLTTKHEVTLYHHLQSLPKSERPQMWRSQLKQGLQEIGSSWKGSYAYLLDYVTVARLRRSRPGTENFIDAFPSSGFQNLEIDFQSSTHRPWWPRSFEALLCGIPSVRLVHDLRLALRSTRGRTLWNANVSNAPPVAGVSPHNQAAQIGQDYLRFTGRGEDGESSRFQCTGILHPLPPQYHIPGWQRIVMVKCFDEKHTCAYPPAASSSATNNNNNNPFLLHTPIYPVKFKECCWVYEGVVLPGGTMMFGRYWSPTEQGWARLSTGPFMYWNVGKGGTVLEDDGDDDDVDVDDDDDGDKGKAGKGVGGKGKGRAGRARRG